MIGARSELALWLLYSTTSTWSVIFVTADMSNECNVYITSLYQPVNINSKWQFQYFSEVGLLFCNFLISHLLKTGFNIFLTKFLTNKFNVHICTWHQWSLQRTEKQNPIKYKNNFIEKEKETTFAPT